MSTIFTLVVGTKSISSFLHLWRSEFPEIMYLTVILRVNYLALILLQEYHMEDESVAQHAVCSFEQGIASIAIR